MINFLRVGFLVLIGVSSFLNISTGGNVLAALGLALSSLGLGMSFDWTEDEEDVEEYEPDIVPE